MPPRAPPPRRRPYAAAATRHYAVAMPLMPRRCRRHADVAPPRYCCYVSFIDALNGRQRRVARQAVYHNATEYNSIIISSNTGVSILVRSGNGEHTNSCHQLTPPPLIMLASRCCYFCRLLMPLAALMMSPLRRHARDAAQARILRCAYSCAAITIRWRAASHMRRLRYVGDVT